MSMHGSTWVIAKHVHGPSLTLGDNFWENLIFESFSSAIYLLLSKHFATHMNTGRKSNFLSSVLPGAQYRMGLINFIKWETKFYGKKGWGNPLKCLCLGKTKKERKLNLITSSMKTYKKIFFLFLFFPHKIGRIDHSFLCGTNLPSKRVWYRGNNIVSQFFVYTCLSLLTDKNYASVMSIQSTPSTVFST